MDSVTENFGKLFNSPLEAGIRAVVLLEKLRPWRQSRFLVQTFRSVPLHRGNGHDGGMESDPDIRLQQRYAGQERPLLVVQLKRLIAERKLTQTAAAKLIEMKQPDLSKLLRGDFLLVSVRS
jgi:Helix-turn-helix domain